MGTQMSVSGPRHITEERRERIQQPEDGEECLKMLTLPLHRWKPEDILTGSELLLGLEG